MAEMIVYNRADYCRDEKNPERYPLGAVIEIHEDGFWTERRQGFGEKYFQLVGIKDKKPEELKYLMEPDEDRTDPENPIFYGRRKQIIDVSRVTFTEKVVTYDLERDVPKIDLSAERLSIG